ncbi:MULTISPECIES: hypothetical protein [unclassified Methylobacterium]|uniref:hypothetical protein n=1 Tax=unclassified Methylobacterium TaxID=2615210 RepID=UPI00030C4D9A|nr:MULTISPECIES: hypothetical protein [Methylobacterium]WFT77754.1 hypothetical protein QA634_20860 [Methylobacterium nodulans]
MTTIRTCAGMDEDCPPERRWIARLGKEIPAVAGRAFAPSAIVVFAADPEELLAKARAAVAEEAMLARRQAAREAAKFPPRLPPGQLPS